MTVIKRVTKAAKRHWLQVKDSLDFEQQKVMTAFEYGAKWQADRANQAKEDGIAKVAIALIERAIGYDPDENNSMNSYPGYYCKYCSTCRAEERKDIKHDIECPVLVAQDLMTGATQ